MSELVEWIIVLLLLQILWAIPASKRKSEPISIDIDWGKWLPFIALPVMLVIGVLTLQNLDRIIALNPQIKVANQNSGGALIGMIPYVFALALGLSAVAIIVQHFRGAHY